MSTMALAQHKLVELHEQYASKLGLGYDVVEKATHIYMQAREKRYLRGYSIEEIAAGTFFIACVLLGKDVSIRDVANAAQVNESLIWSVAKGVQKRGLVSKIAPRRDMANMLRKKLMGKMDQDDINELTSLINRKSDSMKKLAGHVSPRAVLGAVVLLASKSRKIKAKMTQRELSRLFNVNEVSLRIAAKRIKSSFFA